MTETQIIFLTALAVGVALYYRHLARKWSKIPPAPRRPRSDSGWRVVWALRFPFW